MNLVLLEDYRKNQRTLAIHVHTRNDGSYASRNLVKSETLLDISESTAFSHLSFIWLCPPGCTKAHARLDIEGTISKGIRD